MGPNTASNKKQHISFSEFKNVRQIPCRSKVNKSSISAKKHENIETNSYQALHKENLAELMKRVERTTEIAEKYI